MEFDWWIACARAYHFLGGGVMRGGGGCGKGTGWKLAVRKTYLLTAPTADLQKLVVDHMDDEEAFSFILDGLTRKKRPADQALRPGVGP
jgi:hypothetical protein